MMQSASSRPSPAIVKLDFDLLWHVFSLNAEPEDEGCLSPLDTLCNTSQVCSDWRNLILESPSLWGRVLDISSLTRRQWRFEVMKRTGNAWLHIRMTSCSLRTKNPLIDMDSFVPSLLNDHWTRIRSLDLQFSRWCSPTQKWLSVFQRPAPFLETFRIGFHHTEPVSFSSGLFADDAPSLRTFSVTNVALDLTKASWASNLRHLELTSTVPIFELLDSFSVIPFPFLEHLELWDWVPGMAHMMAEHAEYMSQIHTKRSPPMLRLQNPIYLPRLKQITLEPRKELAAVRSLLANITPAAGCKSKIGSGALGSKLKAQTFNLPN